jgi:hypothetical protein
MASFDRRSERHSTPRASPDDSPPAPPVFPVNEHPWLKAFGSAVPIYVVVVIIVAPRHPGSDAYTAGRLIWPALLGALAVGAMAKESEKFVWRWWTYVGGVMVAVGLLTGFVEVLHSRGDDESPGGAGVDAVQQTAQGAGSRLWVPDKAGGWTRIDTRAAERWKQYVLKPTMRDRDEYSAVYADYRRGAVEIGFLGSNSRPGSTLRGDLQGSLTVFVRDYLTDIGPRSPELVESGSGDVAMACGEYKGGVICAWADATALGIVTVTGPKLDVDRAAELTRKFRPHVSQPNT